MPSLLGVRGRFEAALVPFFKGQWDIARPLIEACLSQVTTGGGRAA